VSLKGSDGNDIMACNYQDVSEEKAMKTVSIVTGSADSYTLDISGTGNYKNKISVGKVYITKNTGYIEKFENGYNLLSVKSPWYCDNENSYIPDGESIADSASVIVTGTQPHEFSDGLFTDSSLVKLSPKSSYTISFKTKGYEIGGNACYYYLKVVDASGKSNVIGEWYDRPDEALHTKSFTFITPDGEDLQLVFGVKNTGAYLLDDINLVKNHDGIIVVGEDVGHVNNVRPYVEEKLSSGYVEGFEGMVLHDSTFTYGFNRWGHLTNRENEVISGKYSMSSEIEPETFKYMEDNWYEFMYSNPKYIKLEANTKYKITLKFKLVTRIKLHTDPTLDGYAYIMARSRSGADADSAVKQFATASFKLDRVYELEYEFTVGNSDDYYIVIGTHGRGTLIIDDKSLTKK
jgi:hypothetical protein